MDRIIKRIYEILEKEPDVDAVLQIQEQFREIAQKYQ